MRDQLLAHWAQLAPRERIMVIVAGTALTLTLLFLLVWEPLVQTRQQRAAALDGARAVAVRLEEIAAELGPAAQQSRPTVPAGALLATVDRAARAGLGDTPPSRIQPEQDREGRGGSGLMKSPSRTCCAGSTNWNRNRACARRPSTLNVANSRAASTPA